MINPLIIYWVFYLRNFQNLSFFFGTIFWKFLKNILKTFGYICSEITDRWWLNSLNVFMFLLFCSKSGHACVYFCK